MMTIILAQGDLLIFKGRFSPSRRCVIESFDDRHVLVREWGGGGRINSFSVKAILRDLSSGRAILSPAIRSWAAGNFAGPVEADLKGSVDEPRTPEHRGRQERLLATGGVRFQGDNADTLHTPSEPSAGQSFETPAELWRKGCASREGGRK